jgi:uncharacterized protein
MARAHAHVGQPMPHTEASHLLNPLRSLILSPKGLTRRMDLKPDSHVLELGPGPGYFSVEVARSIPKGKLVLVDVQQEMLDMARERLSAKGIVNVEYYRGDATSLPVDSKSFDVVFLVAVLGEVPDRNGALREINRVLRPDGLLSLTELKLGDPDFISMAEMLRSVQAAGFQCSKQYEGRFCYTVNFTKTT